MTSVSVSSFNPESLDASVDSPRIITTGKIIAETLRIFNQDVRKSYTDSLQNISTEIFEDGLFEMPSSITLPPLQKINRNNYRIAVNGAASGIGIYRVLSPHSVEHKLDIGKAELQLTDASIDTVSEVEEPSIRFIKEGYKIGDVVLGARQYIADGGETNVIVCSLVLDEVELTIFERTGIWGGATMNGIEIC